MTTTPPDGTWFDLERVLAHPPARVFQAWLDPATYARWCWGSMGKDVACEIDAREGGAWSAYMAGGETRFGMLGYYIEILPDERLAYTLHWDAPVGYNEGDAVVGDEIVRATLEPHEEGTRLTVRHMGIIADPERVSVREHRRGWEDVLATLERVLGEAG
ncbi:MAG: SRPBCC family protein [Planctomycetota bacterium]|nr:SRPBCC family protein [Planctomycetota bacterium]